MGKEVTPQHNRHSPNLFIVGAPKCGTTSISNWLSKKQEVWISHPKEPFFLGKDLRPLSHRVGIDSETDYLALFPPSEQPYLSVGEASTLYLASDSAIANLENKFPNARLLCIFRNPVEVAHALHMQAVFAGYEDQPQFEEAWRLSEERAAGKSIPKTCPTSLVLNYRKLISFGSQLQNVHRHFPREQVLCCFFDDLVQRPQVLAEEIESHLGLPKSGTTAFPKSNSAMIAKSRLAVKVLRSREAAIATRHLKRLLPPLVSDGLGHAKRFAMRAKHSRPTLSKELADEISNSVADEIALLENLTGRPLSHWRPTHSKTTRGSKR